MNLLLAVNFWLLVCLLFERGSCLACYATKELNDPEPAGGEYDFSKLFKKVCLKSKYGAHAVCATTDHINADGTSEL